MMRKFTFFMLVVILGYSQLRAQTASTSDNLVAQPSSDQTVTFDVSDTGISKNVEFGADLAWANEQAFRRNILFMGLFSSRLLPLKKEE